MVTTEAAIAELPADPAAAAGGPPNMGGMGGGMF